MSKLRIGYTTLEDEIRNAPLSWLPALTLVLLETVCKKTVFASPEALLRVVQNQINRHWRK